MTSSVFFKIRLTVKLSKGHGHRINYSSRLKLPQGKLQSVPELSEYCDLS
jgi:hypothetical protein